MTDLDPRWRRFVQTLGYGVTGAALVGAVFITVFDPYDNIPFSPPFVRPIMDDNQRYMYPAIARKPAYDSAVFGTSTIRLLDPAKLKRALGGRYAQFGLNNGMAYEQYRLADLFLRHHPRPEFIIWGIDRVWCGTGTTYNKFSERPFPPWMYDENPWNDLLYLFNGKTIEIAGRAASALLGFGRVRYGPDGYANFLPARRDYDLAKVRRKLYGPTGQPAPPRTVTAIGFSSEELASLRFPTHPLLAEILDRLPDSTRKIILFVPYHVSTQPPLDTREGASLHECKKRVTRIAAGKPNTTVLDFMIASPITRRDQNYWDPLHYTVTIAERIVRDIGTAVKSKTRNDDFLILYPRSQAVRHAPNSPLPSP